MDVSLPFSILLLSSLSPSHKKNREYEKDKKENEQSDLKVGKRPKATPHQRRYTDGK